MIKWLLLLSISLTGSFIPEEGEFTVRIFQNGSEVKPVNGEVLLEKTPFRIDVSLERLDGVYVFADFSDTLYGLKEDEAVPGMKDIPPNVMAEASFNENRELLISKAGWAYWFYDPDLDWHRFDAVTKITYSKGVMFLGPKTIRQFNLVDEKKTVAVENADKPLYLFFFSAMKSDDNSTLETELQRYQLKITWK